MKLLTFLTLLISTSIFASTYNRIDFQINEHDLNTYMLKGKKYVFTDSTATVNNGKVLTVKKLSTRGQTSINAPRRSFSVKLKKKVEFNNHSEYGVNNFKTKDFKLVNMWEDNGYVTAQVGYSMFRKFGVYKTPTTYAEVYINGISNGLYMVVETPETYAKKTAEAECFVRRGYLGRFEVKFPKVEDGEQYTKCKETYLEVAKPPKEIKGEELYNYLNARVDMNAYFKWLMINTLLESGDYSDEVFFYAINDKNSPNGQYYNIMGWDPDDIFKKRPHLGLGFQQILLYFGWKKSLFRGLEISLERRFQKDGFFYKKFAKDLITFLDNEINPELIEELTAEVFVKITPYLNNENIKQKSKLDRLNESIASTGYTWDYVKDLLISYRGKIAARKEQLINEAKKVIEKLEKPKVQGIDWYSEEGR